MRLYIVSYSVIGSGNAVMCVPRQYILCLRCVLVTDSEDCTSTVALVHTKWITFTNFTALVILDVKAQYIHLISLHISFHPRDRLRCVSYMLCLLWIGLTLWFCGAYYYKESKCLCMFLLWWHTLADAHMNTHMQPLPPSLFSSALHLFTLCFLSFHLSSQ